MSLFDEGSNDRPGVGWILLMCVLIWLIGVILFFCQPETHEGRVDITGAVLTEEIQAKLRERGLSLGTTVEISDTGYRFEWVDGKFDRL